MRDRIAPGYARRIADPEDRRRVLVELTEKAREATGALIAPMLPKAAPLIDDYSAEDLELLIKFQRQGIEIQDHHAGWLRGQAAR